jgi:phosphoribosylglycinamide formyltransferase-1
MPEKIERRGVRTRRLLCEAAGVSIRLAIFASGAGTTAQAVIDACAEGRIDGAVVLVVSNNADAPVLARAAAAGIRWRHLSSRTHAREDALELALIAALRDAEATHVLLAGYMKRFPRAVLAAFPGRVLNTHPSLLPAYGGEGMYGDRVHAAVLADGAQRTGATVHLAGEDYDDGPIVASVEVAVSADDDVASLRRRVQAAERVLLIGVLAELAERY